MPELPVEIIRSERRKRTLQASVIDGAIRVRVPAGLPRDEEERLVNDLVSKIKRKLEAGEVDLGSRAAKLARRYQLPEPDDISWSDRQNLRWGSCTYGDGTIRISSRLASVPDFVLDYVIVHELAHLEASGHGADFKALENRYKLAERARGYLMALRHTGAA